MICYNDNAAYKYDAYIYGGYYGKEKRYEDKHKEERKAKCMVWGTSIPREKAERINEFLKRYGYTKVELIQAGYEELLARHDTDFAKLKDGYDDFFGFEEVDKKKTE